LFTVIHRHERADAIERLGGDAPAIAQPAGELAVIDCAPTEGRFSEPGLASIIGNFLQQILCAHRARFPWTFLVRRLGGSLKFFAIESPRHTFGNHKHSHHLNGQPCGILPTDIGH
jgi:hypothetical protein